MSFFSHVEMDPNIHLLAISKQNSPETQEIIKEKIHYLLMTRKFDQLLNQTTKLKDFSFPDLKKKLESAKQQSDKQKQELGSEDVDGILQKLESLKDDTETKEIDQGQLKIYKLAKIYYDEGQIEKAYEIIKKLEKQQLNEILDVKTTWALLYCQILLENPKVRKTAERLKKKIDEYEKKQKNYKKHSSSKKYNSFIKQSYTRRQQFINLITVAYFLERKDESFQKYVECCSEEENFAVIQLCCPYIVRYLAVALMLNKTLHKNRKFDLFSLVQALKRKIFKYKDPFIEFLTELNIQFDFESAKTKINDIKKCIQEDILLKPLFGKIIQNCNFLYFKVYCKVYERVPISEIAQFIGKNEDEAQMWILGFIRSLDIEAKIDSVKRVVVSSREEESLNEKYIDLIPKMNSFINSLSQSTFVEN